MARIATMTQRTTDNGQSKSDKKIFAIATAAARLFAVKGYTETSLEDVAGAARMSKGAMYHYFRNKSDILNYILSTFMDVVLDNARQDLAELSDPVERLRIIILRHVKTYVEYPDLAKTLLNEAYNLHSAKLKKIKTKAEGILCRYGGYHLVLSGREGRERQIDNPYVQSSWHVQLDLRLVQSKGQHHPGTTQSGDL